MAVTLILVRHGQAAAKRLGQTDAQRPLTEEGLAAIRAAFPKTMSLVEVSGRTELWVSPAVRARQTAEVANETLGIPDERQREVIELYAQEEDEFLSLACASGADTIVCVGHIPFMNRMVEYLSGQPIQFDTAGVAAVRIDHDVHDMGQLPARLLWFVQGPEV